MNDMPTMSHRNAHHPHRTVTETMLSWALCGLLLMQSFGCAALVVGAAGGAAGAVYLYGKLTEEVEGSVPKVHQATLAALKELNLPIQEERHDSITAKVRSEFSDGKNIWIDLESKTRSSTEITIRVGHVGEGDETRARKILAAIKRHV